MKIVKQIIATLMILTLIGLSGVGIFGLSSTNVDNRRANVALVNEDAGANIQGNEVRYGDDFIKLFVQNKDANYEVTTKVSAQNGINEGKYDLMIVVPKTFTQKAVTYDAAEPERAYLEFAKSNKLSQAEAFKADAVSKVLKETANKTLVQTFTLQVMKTMQAMQGKSLEIIENEAKYQKSFKDNVEKPMADAMSKFDSSLSALASQQGLLGHFDSSVKSFESSVKGQSEAEQKNMQDLSEQRKRYEETKTKFSKWNTSYSETLKGMKESNAVSNLIEAQKLRQTSAEELIKNLKMNAVQLEFQIKKMNEYKDELEKISTAYGTVAETGEIPADTTDGKLKAINDQVNGLIGSEDGQGKQDGEIIKITKENIEKTKTSIETVQLTNICSNISKNLKSLPVGYEKEIASAQEYCKNGNLKMKEAAVNNTTVLYEQTLTIKLPADSTSIVVNGKGFTAKYRYGTETVSQDLNLNGKTNFDSTKNEEINIEVIFSHSKDFTDGIEISPYVPAKDEKFEYKLEKKDLTTSPVVTLLPTTINGEIQGAKQRPMQKETIDAVMKLESLSDLYYGKSVSDLMVEYNAKPTQEDGVKKYRAYATAESLVTKLDSILDTKKIRVELNKAFAKELKANIDEVYGKIHDYTLELQKLTNGALDETNIYKDATTNELNEPSADYYKVPDASTPKGSLNVTIDLAIKQHEETSNLLKDLTAFDSNFKTWVGQYDTISENTGEISKLHETEGTISVQLEESQKQLLTGVESLQKSITSQLESTKQIISDADKLKNDAEGSKKKIEENTEKLNATKKKFDETLKDNSNFVNDFIRQYVSAQSGGADNQLFYQNFANPVALTEKAASNANNLTSFFTILMLSLFALVIARFYNEYRRGFIARKLKSDHGVGNMFAGVTLELGFVAIASVIAAIAVSFIGLQAITDSVNIDKALVYTIVGAALVALAYVFSVILFGFKKYGTQIILAFIALYFLTNGALGLALVKNDSFSWLRAINPLGYMESILQSVFLTQVASVQTLLIVLGVVALVSIVSIYFLQPLMYKQKQSE